MLRTPRRGYHNSTGLTERTVIETVLDEGGSVSSGGFPAILSSGEGKLTPITPDDGNTQYC